MKFPGLILKIWRLPDCSVKISGCHIESTRFYVVRVLTCTRARRDRGIVLNKDHEVLRNYKWMKEIIEKINAGQVLPAGTKMKRLMD